MDSSPAEAAHRQPWPSLWLTAIASLIAQLALCQFFTFGQNVPYSIDVNPCNLWKYAYHFPPSGEFLTLNWFGLPNLPPTLNSFSLAAAHLPPWLFFTAYAPIIGTTALLAMTAFLREMELPRPAALFGGVVYAWQGDLLPFVFPGHYGYITTWTFFALAAWAALRARRHPAYALIAGASCGMMIGLQPDRGSIASLVIAALYLAPAFAGRAPTWPQLRALMLCVVTAALVSLAAFLALFQSNIVGVKLGGTANREQAFSIATQFSLGPTETMTYLVPGFFGWHSSNIDGPYWGWIGQSPGWEATHQGTRNLNLAISTTGTVASILALLGVCLLLPGAQRFFRLQGSTAIKPPLASRSGGGSTPLRPAAAAQETLAGTMPAFTDRQIFFGRVLLIVGAVTLVLSWGYHTPLYRALFALPLMDKWRNPLKWLEGFNFAVVTLSAFGFAYLLRSLTDHVQRRALGLFLAVLNGLLFVYLLMSYPFAIVIAAYLGGDNYPPGEIANVMHTLHVSLLIALVLGLLLWLCLVGAWCGDRLQQWEIVNPWLRRQWHRALAPENRSGTFAVVCATLVALQMGWVATHFIDPTDITHVTATNPLLDSLKSEGPLVRVAVPQPQDSLLNFYLQNQFASDHISSIDISAASRIPDTLTTFVSAFTGHTARLWLLGGVKNVAIAQQEIATLRQDPGIAANIVSADGYTLAPTPDDQPTHALVRLRDYFAKATFVPQAEILKDSDAKKNDDAMLKRLADPKWNPRESVLLATTAPGAIPLQPESPAASTRPQIKTPPAPVPINITRYTPHEIDLAVNAPLTGYILINDQYDPDWQVEVNGKPAPLLRADYFLRAVAVDAGTSNITLRYVPHYHLGSLSLPVIATNNFSDAIMLFAFIAGTLLVRREKAPSS